MNWPAHLFIGLLAGLVLAFFLRIDLFPSLPLILVCGFSALVPDIDHHDSKIRQFSDYLALLLSLSFAVLLRCDSAFCVSAKWQEIAVYFFAIFGAYSFFMMFFMPRHRGFIHSLVAALVYGVVLFFLSGVLFALFGIAGYLSHLLADSEIKVF